MLLGTAILPRIVGAILLVVAIAILANLLKLHFPKTTLGKISALWFAIFVTLTSWGMETDAEKADRFAQVRQNDPGAYLELVKKEDGLEAYLEALLEIDPERHASELTEIAEKEEAERQAKISVQLDAAFDVPTSEGRSNQPIGEELSITSIEEVGQVLKISIETNIAPPFEVMAGLGLAGQDPEDTFIGNSERIKITDSAQVLEVPILQENSSLPTGLYNVEVNFYPRWGAEGSPKSTQAIASDIAVIEQINLSGSGESASAVADKNERQKWVMLNIGAGDNYDLAEFEERLGSSVDFPVENRNQNVRAYYYEQADITIFRNQASSRVLTWKIGRHSRL